MKDNKQTEPPNMKKNVIYFALCWMTIFTSYASVQTMASKLYSEFGYKNMGAISLGVLYFFYAFTAIFISRIIGAIGNIKKIIVFCSFGFNIFQIVGLIVCGEYIGNRNLVWWITICAGAVCGVAAAGLWVSAGVYLNAVTSLPRKSQFFGLFYGIFRSSSVITSLLGTFLLGYFDPHTYFVIFIAIGFIGTSLVTWIQDIQIKKSQFQPPLTTQIILFYNTLKKPNHFYMRFYSFLPGLINSFNFSFLYKVADACFDSFLENDHENLQLINYYTVVVMLMMGFGMTLSGFIINYYLSKYQLFNLVYISLYLANISLLVIFVSYMLKLYYLLLLGAFLSGLSFTFCQSNCNSLVSTFMRKDMVRELAVFCCVQSLGVMSGVAFIILVCKVQELIVMVVLGIFYGIMMKYKEKIKEFKESQEQGEILLKDMMEKKMRNDVDY